MIEIIGWIGSLLLALCGVPQAIKAYKTGKFADGSWIFLLMWGVGEFFTLIFITCDELFAWPLVVNYSLNMAIVGFLCWIKIFGDHQTPNPPSSD